MIQTATARRKRHKGDSVFSLSKNDEPNDALANGSGIFCRICNQGKCSTVNTGTSGE